MMFIYLLFPEKLWIINIEERMAIEEALLWIGDIYEYQCDLIPVIFNTVEYNLDVLSIIVLLLNGWSYLINMFASLTLLPASKPLYPK